MMVMEKRTRPNPEGDRGIGKSNNQGREDGMSVKPALFLAWYMVAG